jgi:hypothetical protein
MGSCLQSARVLLMFYRAGCKTMHHAGKRMIVYPCAKPNPKLAHASSGDARLAVLDIDGALELNTPIENCIMQDHMHVCTLLVVCCLP